MNHPSIVISSHEIKIGCCELRGDWISLIIQDKINLSGDIQYMGSFQNILIFSDIDSYSIIETLPTLTIDLSHEKTTMLAIKELT
ncbi:MAG: hypothetical protein ACTSRL_13040 [Candidatus Helarchaeota archaeon]